MTNETHSSVALATWGWLVAAEVDRAHGESLHHPESCTGQHPSTTNQDLRLGGQTAPIRLGQDAKDSKNGDTEVSTEGWLDARHVHAHTNHHAATDGQSPDMLHMVLT